MLAGQNPKLLVYAPKSASWVKRLKLVRGVAERIAELFEFDVEIATLQPRFPSIYVYYKEGKEEAIPLYCDSSEIDVDDVFTSLKNMLFVLSFHPKHSALRRVRKEIMLPS